MLLLVRQSQSDFRKVLFLLFHNKHKIREKVIRHKQLKNINEYFAKAIKECRMSVNATETWPTKKWIFIIFHFFYLAPSVVIVQSAQVTRCLS
jgi:hypothetical protein